MAHRTLNFPAIVVLDRIAAANGCAVGNKKDFPLFVFVALTLGSR
jgi:hypothetical protein